MSIWEMTRQSFCRLPAAKGMTYGEHVLDMLWLDVTIFGAGLGVLVHAMFPMVLGDSERFLRDRLVARSTPAAAKPTTE